MRWTRAAAALIVLLLVAGVAVLAQEKQPSESGMTAGAFQAFVITWVSFLIVIGGFALNLRRERIAQQEREEATTIQLVKRYVSDADFRKSQDERMIEVGRDLMFREFKVTETMAAVHQLSARVEALSRSVNEMPHEVQRTVNDAVASGVALGVTRAVEALDRERQKEMIHSGRDKR